MTVSRHTLRRMRNVLDKCRKNWNTRFMFCNFFPKIVPFMGLMSKSMVEPEEPKMTSQYGAYELNAKKQCYTHAHACTNQRIRLPSRTHVRAIRHADKYIILTAFPRRLLRERASMLCCRYSASFVYFCIHLTRLLAGQKAKRHMTEWFLNIEI
jgi:hypothetical protein